MSGKARLTLIFPVLIMLVLFLQGCSTSGGGGDDDDGDAGDNLQMTLATDTGTTFLRANGTDSVTIELTVTDDDGQGMAGLAVTFNTTAGTLDSATATTDANGVAQATLTSSTTVDTATVSARVDTGGGSSVAPTPLVIDFISGIPAQLALSATPATVGIGTTSTVLATVSTAAGDPIEGVTVTFDFQANSSGGSLLPTSGTTNAQGEVSVTYTAGTGIGTDTIRASAPGDGGDIIDTVDVTVQTTTSTAASLELLVSSPQLDSDGSETVELTALVRDVNNNAVANVLVTFAASSGIIQDINGTTDASGRATASLQTADDPSNRVIDLTAAAGALADANTVTVAGTTVTISGVSTLVLGQTTTLSILLQDSGGDGIPNTPVTVSSARGNLELTTVTTRSNGQASVAVTASVPGTDTIQAAALGATGTFTLTVSAVNFVFDEPAPDAEVPLGTEQEVQVRLEVEEVPTRNELINFTTTRGVFIEDQNDTCENATSTSTSATTGPANGDPPGIARVTICSTNAGSAIITASCPDCDETPTTQVAIEFVATNPTSLILQASPTTLGVNTEGSSDQQSIITAVVRDPSNNLVKNQTVNFSIFDVSGGRIFPASAITDSFGRASTVYTAGPTPSAQDGVIIDAQVAGTSDRVTLTVAQQALFITLGTGDTIRVPSDTNYILPFKVMVTDANSNPVSGVRVELNLYPLLYGKGFYFPATDPLTGAFISWSQEITAICPNEDSNRNGILEGPEDPNCNGMRDPGEDPTGRGEDLNRNCVLDPGNVATVPAFVITGSNGIAEFEIDYAQDHETWAQIELEARAQVAGSESSRRTTFGLPGLVTDFNNEDDDPPGAISPFGTAASCDNPN